MRNGVLGSCHPAVSFVFFVLVITCTVTILHPVCLAVSILCALSYAAVLKGRQGLQKTLLSVIPLMVLAALLNPLFNHRGVTVLGYLPGGNPLTLESVLYGGAAAVMLGAALCWFFCCSAVMTADKFVCLFGRAAPVLALLLSMVMGYLPKFASRMGEISGAQRCIGRGGQGKGPLRRLQNGVRILSVLATWSLEDAVETADSMKSRGYGLPGRTSFSVFRFDGRDGALIGLMLCAVGGVLWAARSGQLYWRYFPAVSFGGGNGAAAVAVAAYTILCALPVILEMMEWLKWRASHSRM